MLKIIRLLKNVALCRAFILDDVSEDGTTPHWVVVTR